ncbi:glycine zipper 2TM domain-containing protein [Rhizorhabdus phycosphaerae]|uniref:glycine zipper 2TM domain-containing protein n=1 Tax=Rhizorhabdus phycosphaerae TaxID=2711156 RepID=UPI001D03018B|nr:glycine zipper 2TM domain-containing protein [Rhizorhabdus phycosphaerae]
MRKLMIAAGVAALAIGQASVAQAETVCKQDKSGRTIATIAGAGIGAILGRVIDGGRHKEVGTIVGGVAGGVAGNQLAKGDNKCAQAYGYYDENGRWHANRLSSRDARGYYDRDNRWVEGPPNGYYDRNNRWVSFEGDGRNSGYWDREGRWVPIGVPGYYAADGQWVAASMPGYYDRRGRWIEGETYGRYDANGVWVPGSRPSATAGGYWEPATAPGYYDANGRWVRGNVRGYYDARGRWVSLGPVAGNNGVDRRFDTRERAARIEARIDRQRDRGVISKREADAARTQLNSIRREEDRLRASGGRFTANEESLIQQRLDQLNRQIRADREDDDNRIG